MHFVTNPKISNQNTIGSGICSVKACHNHNLRSQLSPCCVRSLRPRWWPGVADDNWLKSAAMAPGGRPCAQWTSNPTVPVCIVDQTGVQCYRELKLGVLHLWSKLSNVGSHAHYVFTLVVIYLLWRWSLPKTIGILSTMFYTSGPNLVILTWIGDELSCGQTSSSELGKIWLWS